MRDPSEFLAEYRTITLEKLPTNYREVFDRMFLEEAGTRWGPGHDNLLVWFRGHIMGRKVWTESLDSVQIPKGILDHIRERLLPLHPWLRRWIGSPQYITIERTINVYNVCPHINKGTFSTTADHYRFLAPEEFPDGQE